MKILFLTSTLPRCPGDHQAPFVLEQASAWKQARPADQVMILAPDDVIAKKRETINGVDIVRFTYFRPRKYQALAYPAILPNIQKNRLLFIQLLFFLAAELAAARRIVKKHGTDLLYAHWVLPQGLIALIIKKIHRTPYVLQNHSSDVRAFAKIPLLGKPLARAVIRNASAMICVNTALRQEALSLFAPSARPAIEEKIHCLPMGVSFRRSSAEPEQQPPALYDFGFIGRLTKKKGADLFLEALALLGKEQVSFRAAVAGDGDEYKTLQTAGQAAGVTFLGFVDGKQKREFFDSTRFFVFPSVPSQGDIEGLPVALLEALSRGKIVLASRATNIELLPEWEKIRDGVYLLPDPRDAVAFSEKLKQLLNLPADRVHAIGQRVASVVNQYGWDNLIREYFAIVLSDKP